MFAVVLIPEFALQAVLRLGPPSSPVASSDSGSPPAPPAALFTSGEKKSIVLAANEAARAAGVLTGMTAPQAVARCPTLLIRTPSVSAESEARAALLAAAFSLSPIIEDTAPGVCTIDLRGTDPSGHPDAARSALARLSALGFIAATGFARTPLLALYAARECVTGASPASCPHTLPSPSEPFLLCEADPPTPHEGEKRKEKDGGEKSLSPLRFVAPADETAFLAPLPLAAADPPPDLAAIFALWGLRTFGDLTALPRDEIVRRFGAAGLALWQRTAGGEVRPLRPVALPREFVAAAEFEDPVETLEPLLFLLRRWLDRLALDLQHAHCVAAEISLTLQLDRPPPYTRTFRLPAPTADAAILFRALHTHLETLQTESPLVGLRLVLSPPPPPLRPPGLF
ncbi:MAG: hypothetical protein HZC55_00005 [Verrucomicrobia bacterium]|nr:hypothetical protein [Verrucomicrobiota bacterium]